VKLKTFTLRLAGDGFDDGPLVDFLEHREALAVHEHFFVHGGEPLWAVLISYREPPREGDAPRAAPPRRDPQAELSAPDRALFESLRRWRNERAVRDGKPAYLLFTNRQLAEIARARPESKAELEAIPGIGEGRIGALGDELLAALATFGSTDGDGEETATNSASTADATPSAQEGADAD